MRFSKFIVNFVQLAKSTGFNLSGRTTWGDITLCWPGSAPFSKALVFVTAGESIQGPDGPCLCS